MSKSKQEEVTGLLWFILSTQTTGWFSIAAWIIGILCMGLAIIETIREK